MATATLTPEELQALFADEFRDHARTEVAWGQLTVTLDADGYVRAAEFARDDPRLQMDFFDCLSGVDEREDGFAVVAILYSTITRQRVLLRHVCEGGRDAPVAPSLTHLYRGADWHEREAWDMFGIEFEGHPGLAPRILTTENFEGWPLRKDFYLATREAKPWPGLKEPLELDDEGRPVDRIVEKGPGAAPGPTVLDELMGEQAKRVAGVTDTDETAEVAGTEVELEAPQVTAPEGEAQAATPAEEASARAERARRKAAEARKAKAEERARAEESGEPEKIEAPPADDEPTATAQDPRVTDPAERGEGAGEGAWHAKKEPSSYAPGEETPSERAERAAEESTHQVEASGEIGRGGPPGSPPPESAPQEQGTTPRGADGAHTEGGGPGSQPPQGGDEAAPGAQAGEPPTTQQPGEAPVDGGLRETADREADQQARSGGERPGSATTTDVPDGGDEDPTATELGGDVPSDAGADEVAEPSDDSDGEERP